MFRGDGTAGSANAAVFVTPSSGVTFQWRSAAGGTTSYTQVSGITAPEWVKLTRVGNAFSAFYSANGTTWTQIGSTESATIGTTAQVGLGVTAHSASALSLATFTNVAVTAASSLPSGWADGDIGSPTAAGSAAFDGTTWTVAGGGSDIWSTADQFNFASESFAGNGSIVAYVGSQTNTNTSAKAGVMFRNDATAGSANAGVFVTPGNGITFQWRSTAGGTTTNISVSGTVPTWLKLTRIGDAFEAYYSSNGTTWTQVGTSESVTIGATALAGLAVTSRNTSAISQAAFTSVSVTAAASLPSGWTDGDIGSPTDIGGATFDGTTWTVAGGGTDIYGAADQFNLASQSLIGNGSIVAEVGSQTNTNSSAKAGVMFRNDATAGSANAAVFVTPSNTVTFQWRSAASGTTSYVVASGVLVPAWVMLTRLGDAFSAYYSTNGTTWTQVGTAEAASIGSTALVGLTVTGRNASAVSLATFTNVAVTATAALPSGWSDTDLGSPSFTGGAQFDGATGAVAGGGAIAADQNSYTYVGATTDSGNYLYESLGSNQQIVTELTSQDDLNAWNKSGLMLRASTASGDAFAGLFYTPGWGVIMLDRASSGASAASPAYDNSYSLSNGPIWLKLTDQSNVVTAYVSVDGSYWSQIGHVTVNLGSAPLAGLAVDSNSTTSIGYSTFTDTSIGAITTASSVPESPSDLYSEAYSGDDGRVVWQPQSGVANYTIQQSADGGTTFQTVATIPGSADTYLPSNLLPSTRYLYRVQATDSSGGNSGYSAQTTLTTGAVGKAGIYILKTSAAHYGSTYDDSMSVTVSQAPTSADSWQQAYFLDAAGSAMNRSLGLTSTIGNFAASSSGQGYYGQSFGFLAENGPNQLAFNDTAGTPGSSQTQSDASSNVSVGSQNSPCPCTTQQPVGYADGAPQISNVDLSSTGFTGAWSIDRSWTTRTQFVADNTFGNGWVNDDQTSLQNIEDEPSAPQILLINGAYNETQFNYNSTTSSYAPASVSNDTLTHNAAAGTYKWLNSETNALSTYYDFSSANAVSIQGKLESYADAGGNLFTITYNSAGQIARVIQTDAGGDIEYFNYTYNTSGANSGQISLITESLQRSDEGSPTIFRQAAYTYYQGTYSGGDAYGNRGDLQTVAIEDGNGHVLEENYYRYYTPADIAAGEHGFAGGLKYVFSGQSFTKLTAAVANPLAASDAQIAPYADNFFQYNSNRQVIEEIAGANGASSSTGQGTFSFSYYTNPNFPTSSTANFNTWWVRTTEQLPNGTESIVYTNIESEPILSINIDKVDPASPSNVGDAWITGNQYDSFGRAIATINPSAIHSSFYNVSSPASYEAYNDLGLTEGGVLAGQGLIETTKFNSTTTATTSAAGSASGYLEADYIQQGLSGTPVEQDSYDYISRSDSSGDTIFVSADSTVYRNTNGTGAETTTYSYTWDGSTLQPAVITTSLPAITTAQNGSGTADVSATAYDSYGRPVWQQDADGYISYTGYDTATGAVIESIADVNTSDTGDLVDETAALPSGWSTPSGGGLNLVTSYQVDDLGRHTQMESPNGNITDYVYDDPDHAAFTLPGVLSVSGGVKTTGPISMVRDQIPYLYSEGGSTYAGLYDETMNFSGTVTTSGASLVLPGFIAGDGGSGGTPNVLNLIGNGTSSAPQFTIESLSRNLYHSMEQSKAQLVESDAYANIDDSDYLATPQNSPYSGSLVAPGTSTGNYDATLYAYDSDGQQYQTIDPNGTITDSVFDGEDRLVETWVGTNDSSSGGAFNGTNDATGNNMTEVSSDVYDNGGVGDGNLTQSTEYPGGGQAPRVTENYYDWRDRLVASKSGLLLSGGSENLSGEVSGSAPITYTVYDNLGEAIEKDSYDGAGVAVTSSGGVPSAPSSSLLRSNEAIDYDNLGRVYQTQQYSVDPVTGAVSSTALTTSTFYNNRGEVIEQVASTGQTTKYSYDGAGREVISYVTDGGAVNNAASAGTWLVAASVAGDIVLTQTQEIYDDDGNVIETVTADRLPEDSTTAVGALGAGGPAARVSYAASYYDAADRDIANESVGTNGGVAWTRPSSPDASDANHLVTTISYNTQGLAQDVTDPRGIDTQTLYDALGRTVETIADYTDGTPTNNSNQTTAYTYDGDGHTLTMTAVMPSGTPSQTTQYVYGVSGGGNAITSNDLLGTVEYPDPTTGNASTSSANDETYTYDALGEMTSKTDRDGNVHAYSYDTLGRQTLDAVTTLGGGVDGTILAIGTTYNSQGLPYQQTSYSDSSATTVMNQTQDVYNGLGQLAGEYQSHSGAVSTSTTPEVQYAYSDPSTGSRLAEMVYPSGRIIHYGYDNSALDNAIGRMDYLAEDNRTGGMGVHDVDYYYLGLSTVIGQINDAGVTETTTLDPFGRIAEMNSVNSAGTTTDDFQYGYDADGNVLYKDNNVDPSLSELYSYDNLNRITSDVEGTLNSGDTAIVGTPTSSQSWTYDALGNQLAVTTNGTETDNTVNSQNELTADGSTTLAYDNNGNTTTDENGNTLTYNAWNQLVSVKNPGGTTIASNTYDAKGNRISQTESGATTDFYISNQGQTIEERQGSTVTAQNVWNPDYVNDLLQRTQGSSMYYAQHDANFDVTSMTDTGGNVLERYTYQAYGTVTVRNADGSVEGDATIASSSIGSPYLFQGGRLDMATGLYHFGERDYDQSTGKWKEQDPAGYVNGPNTYGFEKNRPANSVDPTGLQVVEDEPDEPEPEPSPISEPAPQISPDITELQQTAQDIEDQNLALQGKPPLSGPQMTSTNADDLAATIAAEEQEQQEIVQQQQAQAASSQGGSQAAPGGNSAGTQAPIAPGPLPSLPTEPDNDDTGVGGTSFGNGGDTASSASNQAAAGATQQTSFVQSGNQQAMNSLIQQATNNGTTPLSVEDANTVLDWALELNIQNVRAGEGDVSVPSNWTACPNQPHIHIPNTGLGGHIPVEPGVTPR
jgi:RHS repeat-associated protein